MPRTSCSKRPASPSRLSCWIAIPPRKRPELYSDDPAAHAKISAAGQSGFIQSLAHIDERLSHQEWICSAQFTTADIYTHVFHSWARLSKFPISDLVNLKRHGEVIMRRPSAQAMFKREGLPLNLMD